MRFASLGEYRLRTFQHLIRENPETITIEAGDRSPDGTVRVLTPETLPAIRKLRNVYLPGDILLQLGQRRNPRHFDLLITDLNPRVPQVWWEVLSRRASRRPVLLWGHAWPRKGSAASRGFLRPLLMRASSGVITYTRTQARELKDAFPQLLVVPAPNAIFERKYFAFDTHGHRDRIAYVGRLVEQKKPELLVEAVSRLSQTEANIALDIVGDGPLRTHLERLAHELGVQDKIVFHGHQSDYNYLANIYRRCFASISPGYVGLSITQSLAFGVPLVYSANEPHAPEIEAAKDGFNSMPFRADDVDDLCNVILGIYKTREQWAARGASISSTCAEEYSVEAMVAGLTRAIRIFR